MTVPISPLEIWWDSKHFSLKSSGSETLGEGSQSEVYPGVLTENDGAGNEEIQVAIKCIDSGQTGKEKERENDVKRLVEAGKGHPNLIQYYCYTALKDFDLFVMEKMEKNLDTLFFGDKNIAEKCTYKKLLEIFMKIAGGLQRLHKKKVVHGCIKPSNILISSDGEEIKISDYGSSPIVSDGKNSVTKKSKKDTIYEAPESICRRIGLQHTNSPKITQEADVYSFGCMLWECANLKKAGTKPTAVQGLGRAIDWFKVSFQAERVQCNAPEKLCDLIEECLLYNSAGQENSGIGYGRPNAVEIVTRLGEMKNEKWAKYKIKECKQVCVAFETSRMFPILLY